LVQHREIGWRINNLISLPIKTLEVIRENPNIILHIAAPTPVTRPLGVSEIGRRLKIPMVLDIIDVWSDNPFSHNPVSMLQTQIMRRAINNSDHVIVCHEPMKRLVEKINKAKPVSIIPNGVDAELFSPKQRNAALGKEIGIEEDNIVVAFCGHVTNVKGLDVLSHAAKTIIEKHDETIFLIIGDGPFLNETKALTTELGLSRKFKFVGFVPSQVNYLSLADICVAPYIPVPHLEFVHPMKTAEYMAMEKPVVISKLPSEEDVIALSGGGIQVAPGNVAELASSIIGLIEDEDLRKTLGKRGRRYVEQNLSWSKIAQKLVGIYESVIS
jgi:glycosyltransferase involved in cell wall biosynthesis